jgi:hypothetical protein
MACREIRARLVNAGLTAQEAAATLQLPRQRGRKLTRYKGQTDRFVPFWFSGDAFAPPDFVLAV